MVRRTPRVYFCQGTSDKNAILAFDAGHDGGTIYVYEFKEARDVKEIEKEMKEQSPYKIAESEQKDIVRMWVEHKFGFPMYWKLTPE